MDFGESKERYKVFGLVSNRHDLVNTAMKRLALGGKYVKSRMKAIRYVFINVAGRLVQSGRRLVIHLSGGNTCMELLLKAGERIFALAHAPPG